MLDEDVIARSTLAQDVVPNLALEADIGNKAVPILRVNARGVGGVGVAVGISVFAVEQINDVVAIFDYGAHGFALFLFKFQSFRRINRFLPEVSRSRPRFPFHGDQRGIVRVGSSSRARTGLVLRGPEAAENPMRSSALLTASIRAQRDAISLSLFSAVPAKRELAFFK